MDLAKAVAWLPRRVPDKALVLREQPPNSEPHHKPNVAYFTRQAPAMPKVLTLWEPPPSSELHYEGSLATAASGRQAVPAVSGQSYARIPRAGRGVMPPRTRRAGGAGRLRHAGSVLPHDRGRKGAGSLTGPGGGACRGG